MMRRIHACHMRRRIHEGGKEGGRRQGRREGERETWR